MDVLFSTLALRQYYFAITHHRNGFAFVFSLYYNHSPCYITILIHLTVLLLQLGVYLSPSTVHGYHPPVEHILPKTLGHNQPIATLMAMDQMLSVEKDDIFTLLHTGSC